MTSRPIILITWCVGAVGGAAAGWILAKKKLEQKYADISELEIAEAKAYYSAMYKKDEFETPEKAVEALGTPTGIVKKDPRPSVHKLINELGYRNGRTANIAGPFVIEQDTFMQNDEEYGQVTLTYYVGDDILTHEDDEIVEDRDIIGAENLDKFGEATMSPDDNIVYVRNDRLKVDYEIVRHQGKFSEVVLGFVAEEMPKKKPRK